MTATIALGTMNFGGRTDGATARRIIDAALDHGVTVFDTANLYAEGESERILGAAMGARRARVKVHSKVGLWKREGLSRARVLASVDESLTRLATDHLDVLYLHAPDPLTPFDETLEALGALLRARKILGWGVSNFAAWQVLELNHRCDAFSLARPVSSQVLYNLLIRQLDVEYFSFVRQHPLHTTVYNPLAGGLLARPPVDDDEAPKGSRFDKNPLYRRRYWTPALRAFTRQLSALGSAEGHDLVSLSYGWLSGHAGVDSVLVGPATLEHFSAAVKGCATVLSPGLRSALDAAHQDFVGTDARYAR